MAGNSWAGQAALGEEITTESLKDRVEELQGAECQAGELESGGCLLRDKMQYDLRSR